MQRQRYLILAASAYNYKDKTGTQKQGCEITYVKTDNLSPKNDTRAEENGGMKRGHKPTTQRLPYSTLKQFGQFPGMYEVTLGIEETTDRFGNDINQIVVTEIEFISTVNLTLDKPKPQRRP